MTLEYKPIHFVNAPEADITSAYSLADWPSHAISTDNHTQLETLRRQLIRSIIGADEITNTDRLQREVRNLLTSSEVPVPIIDLEIQAAFHGVAEMQQAQNRNASSGIPQPYLTNGTPSNGTPPPRHRP